MFKYQPGFSVATMGGTFTRASTATYFDVNGVLQTANSGVIRDGAYVGGVLGTLLEDTRTNIVLQNRDLSNAAWTKTTMTAAKDQTGIDGASNSASSLLATAGNATVLQAITLASSTRNQSAYVKRLVGSGTINMTTDGGTTWNVITVTAGWTRVTFSQAAVTNPNVGFQIVTNGDKIAVDYVQNETGTFASSPIAVTTVAVVRAADQPIFPTLFPETPLTGYLRYTDQGSQATGNAGLCAVGDPATTPSLVLLTAGTGVGTSFSNGTATVSDGRVTSGIVFGDSVEVRGTLSGAGSCQASVARNGGAESFATASAGQAFGVGWGLNRLTINEYGASHFGFMLLQSAVIAVGVQSLQIMRTL